MPALGAGLAGFDIARASEIIIEELLARLVTTPIRHVVLALIGDEAERLFYEQLVRANAPRCAESSLRLFEQQLAVSASGSGGATKGGAEEDLSSKQDGPPDLPKEPTTAAPSRVALFYKRGAQPDEEVVSWLEQELTAHGYRVFLDRGMRIGLSWAEQLQRGIADADAVVALLSSASVSSEMVEWELNSALECAQSGQGRPRLLAVRLNFEAELSSKLAPILDHFHHFDWGGPQDSPRLLTDLLDALPITSPLPPRGPGGTGPIHVPPPDRPQHGLDPAQMAGESGEQFPSLVDETRLAATPSGQPKLVAGLAAIVLKHAAEADVEGELLSRPECYGFRGSIEQRLMEFLYLGEKNLRTALGSALFRARDLRQIAEELGQDCEVARDPDQLIDLILRALCFNLLVPPVGMTQYAARVERLILDLEVPGATEGTCVAIGVEAAKVLEQVLKDILRLYSFYFFGSGFEQELVNKNVVPARRDGGVTRVTLGQARDALIHLEGLTKKDGKLRDLLSRLGRVTRTLLPATLAPGQAGNAVKCDPLLSAFIRWRNQELIHDDPSASPLPGKPAVRQQLAFLRDFLLACRSDGIYPEVFRYEGTYENRNGERFVHFADERNVERKVRTDEKIDPRRHYYCFATNNPVHLFPVLVPKL
jgi:hypothetical protein